MLIKNNRHLLIAMLAQTALSTSAFAASETPAPLSPRTAYFVEGIRGNSNPELALEIASTSRNPSVQSAISAIRAEREAGRTIALAQPRMPVLSSLSKRAQGLVKTIKENTATAFLLKIASASKDADVIAATTFIREENEYYDSSLLYMIVKSRKAAESAAVAADPSLTETDIVATQRRTVAGLFETE